MAPLFSKIARDSSLTLRCDTHPSTRDDRPCEAFVHAAAFFKRACTPLLLSRWRSFGASVHE
jgi:hypothetical protein